MAISAFFGFWTSGRLLWESSLKYSGWHRSTCLQEIRAADEIHTRALLHSLCIAPRNKKASETSLADSDEGMLTGKYRSVGLV